MAIQCLARTLLLYCADFVLSCDTECSDMHPTALYTHFKGLHYFFFSHCLDLDWLGKISTLLLACGSIWKNPALLAMIANSLPPSEHSFPIRCESNVHGRIGLDTAVLLNVLYSWKNNLSIV